MAANVGTLNILLSASANGLKSAFSQADKAVQGLQKTVKSAFTGIPALITAIGGAAAIGGIIALTKASFDQIEALHHQAAALGVTTAALGALQFAARDAGVDADGLNTAMGKMLKAVDDARNGTGPAVDAFRTLGLNAQQLAQMKPDEAFAAIAHAMSGIQNPAQRVSIAMDIFGKSGRQLLPVLEDGAKGFEEQARLAGQLGLAVSSVDAENVHRAGDAFNHVMELLQGIGNTIASFVAPYVEDLSNRLVGAATSGEGIGPKVGAALEWVAKGIAGASDYLYLLSAGFHGFRAGALEAIAGVIGAMDFLAQGMAKVINFFGGHVEWTALADLKQGFEDVAAEEAQKFDDALGAFNSGKNKAAVEDYFKTVRENANATSQAVVDADAKKNRAINDAVEKNKAAEEAQKQLQKMNDELDKQAEKVKEDIQTPFEKAQAELDKLVALYESGRLSADEFAKAQQKLQDDLDKTSDKAAEKGTAQAPKLLKANSNEAFALVNEIQGRGRAASEKIPEKQLDAQHAGNALLKQILAKTGVGDLNILGVELI